MPLPQCRTNRVSTFDSNRFINNVSQGFGGAIKVCSARVSCCKAMAAVIVVGGCSVGVVLLQMCVTVCSGIVLGAVTYCLRSSADGAALLLQVGSPDGGCKPKIQLNTFQGNRAKLTVSAGAVSHEIASLHTAAHT